MRLFIAIALPAPAASRLAEELQVVQRLAPQLRWMKPETWHMTLQFLGNVTAERTESLIEHLESVKQARFSLKFARLECFDRAGALVALLRTNPALDSLRTAISQATSQLGFVEESRPFTPHITVARWKGTLPVRASGALNQVQLSGEFAADRFALFQSFTESSGARYEILRSYPLAG